MVNLSAKNYLLNFVLCIFAKYYNRKIETKFTKDSDCINYIFSFFFFSV